MAEAEYVSYSIPLSRTQPASSCHWPWQTSGTLVQHLCPKEVTGPQLAAKSHAWRNKCCLTSIKKIKGLNPDWGILKILKMSSLHLYILKTCIQWLLFYKTAGLRCFFFSIKKIGGELSGGQGSEPPPSAAKLWNTVFMFSRCSVE